MVVSSVSNCKTGDQDADPLVAWRWVVWGRPLSELRPAWIILERVREESTRQGEQ